MLRFCANLSLLFTEHAFTERYAAAAACGFRGVECHFPYAFAVTALQDALARHALTQVLFNLPAGDWAAGERGIACLPERRAEFQDGVGLAIEYAKALDCQQVNCLAGLAPPDAEADRLWKCLADNLSFAADALAREGIRLLIEPINTRDMPGFLLNRSAQAIELINRLEHPNLYLQYDLYHMQIMEGDLANTLSNLLHRIGHIQFADNPGRHEPGTGEINFPFIFQHLERIGYTGWLSAEYIPLGSTSEGLNWMLRCKI